MEWRTAIEEDAAVLKRIVALLFALAGLAELAAGRSPAVRSLVLWLLRHAESAAWELVAFEPETSLESMPVVPTGGSPEDAMHLAARLRALAMQIGLLAAYAVHCTYGSGPANLRSCTRNRHAGSRSTLRRPPGSRSEAEAVRAPESLFDARAGPAGSLDPGSALACAPLAGMAAGDIALLLG